jgi:hypothetical protein
MSLRRSRIKWRRARLPWGAREQPILPILPIRPNRPALPPLPDAR